MLTDLPGNILGLYLDAAPWLVLGLVAAGLVKAWVPESAMQRWLGGRGLWPVTRAALVGAPLPLCSCGVLPAAIGLRRAGASRGSTVSFLIATPETGVDSVAVTYALMGPFMTVIRPVSAIISAIVTGALAGLAPERPAPAPEERAGSCGGGCCSSTCSGAASPSPSAGQKTAAGLRYAVTDILDDIAPWLGVGLLLGGALLTFVPPNAMADWGSGPLAMAVMVLVGVPMYICATASTPLAAALLVAGVSPGTVLVFLLAGPATNLATIAMVRRELGGWVTIAYMAGITASSIGLGLLTDMLVRALAFDIQVQSAEAGEMMPAAVTWVAGLLLAVAAIPFVRRKLFRLGRTADRATEA
jgi:uncharacterized membrane protein YraQ (UPF0718 family)